MKNNGLRKWLIHKLGGVTPAETAFSNAPYVVKQYEKVPVKLASHSRVDSRAPEEARTFILKVMAGRITDAIMAQKLYTLRELDRDPHSVDGHELEMTVEILPPME